MRFDPITGIWAANKAAELVGGTGGSDELAKIKADGGVGYTEYGEEIILPETTYDFQPVDDFGGAAASMVVPLAHFEDGYLYTINWNGVAYERRTNLNYIGNKALVGQGEDTGEPFLIVDDKNQNVCLVISASVGEIIYSAKKDATIVHPIAGKYQSIDCSYTLTTEIPIDLDREYVRLNEVDSAAIQSISARSDVIVLYDTIMKVYFPFIGRPVEDPELRQRSVDSAPVWYNSGYDGIFKLYLAELHLENTGTVVLYRNIVPLQMSTT